MDEIAEIIAEEGLTKWDNQGHSVPRFLEFENIVGTIPVATEITVQNTGEEDAILVNCNLEGLRIEAGTIVHLGRKGLNASMKIIANITKVKVVYYG